MTKRNFCRRGLIRLTTVAALLFAISSVPASAGFFDSLDEINPFASEDSDTRMIDALPRRPWEASLQRAMAESDDPEALQGLPDGVTALRMSSNGLIRNHAISSYLEDMGQRLLAGSPITGAPIQFVITANVGYGEAMAMHDGAIGIPIGLLRKVESQDELAFVLAHEIAHVLLKHHDIDWFLDMQGSMISAAEIGLTFVDQMAKKVGASDLDQSGALKGLRILKTFYEVNESGIFPAFTREQEEEADFLGLDLMVRAGYSYNGALDVIARLIDYEEAEKARREAEKARTEELGEEIEEAVASGDFGGAAFGIFDAIGAGIDDIAGLLGRSHYNAEARQESLFEYMDSRYADDAPADSSATPLIALQKRPDVAALFANYDHAREAYRLLQSGKIKDAAGRARSAVGGGQGKDSWPRFVFSETRAQQGDKAKAAKNLEIALGGWKPTFNVYRNLSALYWDLGQREKAKTLLSQAMEEFDNPPQLYAELIYREQQTGNHKKAQRLALECRVKKRAAAYACDAAVQGKRPEDVKKASRGEKISGKLKKKSNEGAAKMSTRGKKN